MKEVRKSGFLWAIPFIINVVMLCSVAHDMVIHVNNDGQEDFDNIQAGIDAADDGDTVLVAPGEYVITEPITFRGKAITVKSQDGPDETTIRMGEPSDTNRGSVVVFENNETAAPVLDGFTITGGEGIFIQGLWGGGGILFIASSGTLNNCVIVQNRSRDAGGGVCCAYDSSVTMNNCTITENSAEGGGGGGGVIVYSGSSATLTNCDINRNSANIESGGGICCAYDSLVNINNCTIIDNSTRRKGGGGIISYNKSLATLTNCLIARNSTQWGGGVMSERESSSTLTNCIICGNSASLEGGGVVCYNKSLTIITNCTIWGNSAAQSGGGVECLDWSSSTVMNSIIWRNSAPKGRELSVKDAASALTISYSNVADGQTGVSVDGGSTLDWGEGNIDADPLFADPNNGDFHLKSEAGRWDPNSQSWMQDDVTSPCIDAGDPNSDWMGEIWPHGERINVGAFGGTLEASMFTKLESMSLPRVAYVYGSDAEATESFRSLLMSYGCPTTLIGVDDVATAALDSYDLIVVASDTKYLNTWIDAQSVAPFEDSGKPIIGLGQGGYDFFGVLELWIGRPNGGHGSRNSIEVIDPNCSLFSMPYSVDIPENRALQLYTETNHIGIYLWPTIPETITVLGSEVNDYGYFPLVMEDNRYLFWGFTESPLNMTEEGKRLFINVVIRASNNALGS